MRPDEQPLSGGERRAAASVGGAFLLAALLLGLKLGQRWWMVSGVLCLIGVLYLRDALRGRTASDDEAAPAPGWLRARLRRARRRR